MKKTVCRNALALALVAIAAQASAQVTFYEREGFQGESFTTRRPVADFGRFGFNDRASSAVVGGEGWERWQVCEDARFNGRCVVLRPGQYPTLQAMGLNNRISSMQAVARVDTLPPPLPVAVPAQGPGSVVFYEREGFGGRSLTTQTELADLGPSGFNDQISAIEVFGGPWEVCADAGFGGKCAVLRPGKYPSLKQMGLDNRISSVRAFGGDAGPAHVAPQVTFYERENFSGRSFVAQADVPDFGRGGFNDRASSVEVVGGWFEVCQGGGYTGQCAFLRPGKYPSLVAMGLNNRISSVRLANGDGRAPGNLSITQPPTALYDARRRDNEQLFEANVVAVRAVVGPPEQRCWVDRDQVAVEPARPNIGAGIAGALIGGILGHQIGDGRGRDLATVGAAIAGGALGASVGRDGRSSQTQDVQRCTSVPSQARPDLWDVTYSFRGQEHRVQMTSPPGATIMVNRDGEPRA
jgi:uncharacterized protein YcfJ